MEEMNELESAVKNLGDKIITLVKDDYDNCDDAISKEIVEFQKKYGRRWFRHYCKAAQRLSQKEVNKLK